MVKARVRCDMFQTLELQVSGGIQQQCYTAVVNSSGIQQLLHHTTPAMSRRVESCIMFCSHDLPQSAVALSKSIIDRKASHESSKRKA